MHGIPYFDAHCDTLLRCLETGESLRQNTGNVDLRRLSAYAPMGQIFSIFNDSKGKSTAECIRAVEQMSALFLQEKHHNPELMERCFLSLEGAEQIGCDEKLLPKLKEWGVRWVNLTWNYENALSGSCVTGNGLTDLGRSFVRRLYELGMYVDLSHLSDRGFWEVCEMDVAPVLASHSDSRTLWDHRRNLTDEMAREIFRRKGIVGINFHTVFLGGHTLDDVVAHIEHFLALGGEDRLVMGSDFDGADMPDGLEGAECLPRLWEALYRRNYSESLIEKLAFGNLCRFLGC